MLSLTRPIRLLKNNNNNIQRIIWNKHPYSTTNNASDNNKTTLITTRLRQRFGEHANIKVEDVSGGCGDFFDIVVESAMFKNIPMVQQHRMVTDLINDIDRHGATIRTKIAPS
jgi:stress-induced morphogen